MKQPPVSVDDFRELIMEEYYYVDKTKVIEELFYNKNKLVLFQRPRRFGKSLLLSTIDYFFNIDNKENNKDLFKGLYIENSEYFKEFGKYPVIHVDFKSLKFESFEELFVKFKALISKLYKQKEYVREVLDEDELKKFNLIKSEQGSKSDYEDAINLLSMWLERYHKEKVVILIDEYDVPVMEGYMNHIYDEIIKFMREVFSNALKGNNSLRIGILTGVTRVSKESIFSGFNNLKIYDIMTKGYGEYFGFTEVETKKLLEYFDLELTSKVKELYDGYNFGGVRVYNPWSILNYVQDKTLVPYWINTSGNALIKEILKETNEKNKKEIEKLILGESISFTYDNTITFSDLKNKINEKNTIFNLLLASGYLTFDKMIYNEVSKKEREYYKIPNLETKEEFIKMIKEINSQMMSDVEEDEFLVAILSNDVKKIEEYINETLVSMSYYDTKEMFYHGYLLGLFTIFIDSEYMIKSNRESGLGRYDLMIEKKDKSIGIVIEIKLADKKEEMESMAVKAKQQMKEKEYYKDLKLDGVEKIEEYAIIFCEKSCIVR